MIEREKLIAMVRGLQNGDPDASNQLFETFQSDIYYFILKTVNNDRELAEDLTQDTFIEILETINKLQEPAAFVTWSKQIAYHKCTAYFRKRKELLVDENEDGYSVFDTVEEDREEFIPDAVLDHEDLKQTIIQMINDLPEEQKSAILLRYFNEISVKEIAEIQGVTEGTVKSRLNYGRKAIKQSVEEYEKKNDVKLHCTGVLPLLLWLFKMYRVEMGLSITSTTAAQTFFAGEAVAKTAAAIGATASTSASTAAATAASTSATTSAAATTAASSAVSTSATTVAAATKTAAAVGGKALATKIVAGVAAAAITVGGVAVGLSSNKECEHVWTKYESIDYNDEIFYSAEVCCNCGEIEVLHQSQRDPDCEEHEWKTFEKSYENFVLEGKRCSICLKTELSTYENTCKHSFSEYQVTDDDGTTLTRKNCVECGCLTMEGDTSCLHIHRGPEFHEDNTYYDITCADCGDTLQQDLPSCLMGGDHVWCDAHVIYYLEEILRVVVNERECRICNQREAIEENYDCSQLHYYNRIAYEDENATYYDLYCLMCDNILQRKVLACRAGGEHLWGGTLMFYFPDGEIIDKTECAICGLEKWKAERAQTTGNPIESNYSKGLEFKPYEQGVSYKVSGRGECTDTHVVIPSEYRGLPVVSIGYAAFVYDENLQEVTIPSTVKIIEDSAFEGCINLQNISIPNSVMEIEKGAFQDCDSLTSIEVPEGTKRIGTQAFSFCNNLKRISFPSTLEEIEGHAPANYCDNLETITVAAGNPRYISVDNCLIDTYTKTLINATNQSVIPSDGSIETIGQGAFGGLKYIYNISIPEGVTTIEDYSIHCCENLAVVYIPKSVNAIHGRWMFEGCDSLADIYYAGTLADYDEVEHHSGLFDLNTDHEFNVHFADITLIANYHVIN